MQRIPTTRYVRRETDSLDDLKALLEGHVFHVTKLAHFKEILKSGFILPSAESQRKGYGYENSFFRKRNCVSLFDYREMPSDDFSRDKCSPFQLAFSGRSTIAMVLLRPSIYGALVPWTRWHDEQAYGEQVVPYIEIGHPGPIDTSLIDKVIFLTLKEDPNSLAALIRRAYAKHRASK